uniref:Sulfhydryl oxidase n=1 Tax=Drosophila rhopaloa TaxID=1041015 RepID=A0A6P4FKH6_DRORH
MEELIPIVSPWRKVLAVYFFDCTKEDNLEVCREYKIRHKPSLRFFHVDLVDLGYRHGFDITTQGITYIQEELVPVLGYPKHHNLNFNVVQPNETLKTLWLEDMAIKYLVLVYQPSESVLGMETALDMLPYRGVSVRIVDDYAVLKEIANGERLTIFKRNGNEHSWETISHTVKAYVHVLQQFLKAEGYPIPSPPHPIKSAEGADSFHLEQDEIRKHVLKGPVRIYRADLERAIYKLLHIEIPKAQNIEGQSLNALKNFMRVLAKINPLNRKGKIMLRGINKWLKIKSNFTGDQFLLRVYSLEQAPSQIFGGRHYVGCVSSKPFLREYSCSLWILFHFLTVAAAEQWQLFKPGFVLNSIKGFVQHFFFECPSCSDDFTDIANHSNTKSVNSHDEEILWLWETHNEFNKRLEDDDTQDPGFLKIQFPSKAACQHCKNGDDWMRPKVLNYLKNLYDIDSLSFYGLPSTSSYD